MKATKRLFTAHATKPSVWDIRPAETASRNKAEFTDLKYIIQRFTGNLR